MFAGPPPGSDFAWESTSSTYHIADEDDTQYGRPVVGHAMVNYEGSLIVWGGYSQCEDEEVHYRPTDQIYVLPAGIMTQSSVIKWIICDVSDMGAPPPTSGACAVLLHHFMVIFGGYVRHATDQLQQQGHTSTLFMLDLKQGSWRTIGRREGELIPTPRDKTTGWTHQQRCYFFGGYGPSVFDMDNPSLYLRRGGEFFADNHDTFYWNNQLLIYDDSAPKRWSVATTSGSIPSARAASSSTYLERRGCVLLFGGRHAGERLFDLYLLDLETLIWTSVDVLGQSPCGRSWCTLTAVGSDSALLYGGFSTDGLVLSDSWRIEILTSRSERVVKGRWTRVNCLKEPAARLWHTAAFVDGLLFVCGGSDIPLSLAMTCSKVIRLRTSPPSLLALCFTSLSHCLHDISILPDFLKNRFFWLLYLRSRFAVSPPDRARFRMMQLREVIAMSNLR
uniref:Kelch domain-containing protein n=2 Tax=Ascaris TaxID=6251 RepID=A0A0M3IGM9_ASCLU